MIKPSDLVFELRKLLIFLRWLSVRNLLLVFVTLSRYMVQLVNMAARYLSGPVLHSSGFAVSYQTIPCAEYCEE
jgi:hypothetical protein